MDQLAGAPDNEPEMTDAPPAARNAIHGQPRPKTHQSEQQASPQREPEPAQTIHHS
jgi:hypothetical protein